MYSRTKYNEDLSWRVSWHLIKKLFSFELIVLSMLRSFKTSWRCFSFSIDFLSSRFKHKNPFSQWLTRKTNPNAPLDNCEITEKSLKSNFLVSLFEILRLDLFSKLRIFVGFNFGGELKSHSTLSVSSFFFHLDSDK